MSIFFKSKRNFISYYTQWFSCGTSESALLILYDYEIFLTKWPTVHNAALLTNNLLLR